MKEVKRSVFLEKSSYRKRRARDASRLLPLFGLCLFMLPGLWQGNEDGAIRLSSALIFLFFAWCVAIILAAFLSRFLSAPVVGDNPYLDATSED